MTPQEALELARLVEAKQAAAMAEMAIESEPIGGGVMAFGGPGSYVNRACGIGAAGPVDPAELDRVVAFFVSRGVEPAVDLSAFADAALLDALAGRGFVLRDVVHVLARPIDAAAGPSRPGWPQGVRIERVDPADEAAVRTYVETSASGFVPEGAPVPATYLEAGLRAARVATHDAFLAWAGGEVVGAAGSESSGGLTSLFGTSVRPAHRRRGIQQALIAARLARGRERGSRLAVIMSRPATTTERNASRLGFSAAYARLVFVRHGSGLARSP